MANRTTQVKAAEDIEAAQKAEQDVAENIASLEANADRAEAEALALDLEASLVLPLTLTHRKSRSTGGPGSERICRTT